MLVRALGRWSLVAIVINGVIGSAVFVLPGTIGGALGWRSLIAWGAAALLTAAIVFCFAEVASRFDESGGVYLFTREAFGSYAALQIGWMSYFVRAITAATQANLFATYLAEVNGCFGTPAGGVVAATLFIGSIATLNVRGVVGGARTSNFFAYIKLFPLGLFLLIGLVWILRGQTIAHPMAAVPTTGEMLRSTMLLMFAYGGFELVVIPLAEAKEPGKDAPFALLVGLGLSTLIYMLSQAVVLATVANPAANNRVLAESMRVMTGAVGAVSISIAAALSVTGWMASNMLTVPRMSMAMAESGDFPGPLAKVHPVFRTPWISVIAFGGLAWLLSMQASLLQNLSLSAVSRLFVYASVCASLPLFRSRERAGKGRVGPARYLAPAGVYLSVIGVLGAAILAARMNQREAISMVVVVALASLQWLYKKTTARTNPDFAS